MTTSDLTALALPRVRLAVKAARPRAAFVLGPFLPLVVRLVVELLVALTAPQALPVLEVLLKLESLLAPWVLDLVREAASLYRTPRADLHPAVLAALDPAAATDAGPAFTPSTLGPPVWTGHEHEDGPDSP